MSELSWHRREFVKITAGAGMALALPALGESAVTSSSKMIGIQVGAISFVDEHFDIFSHYLPPAQHQRVHRTCIDLSNPPD